LISRGARAAPHNHRSKNASSRNEHLSYERLVIDLESRVVRERNQMKREHLERLAAILNGEAEE
jgi:hypothetical protein